MAKRTKKSKAVRKLAPVPAEVPEVGSPGEDTPPVETANEDPVSATPAPEFEEPEIPSFVGAVPGIVGEVLPAPKNTLILPQYLVVTEGENGSISVDIAPNKILVNKAAFAMMINSLIHGYTQNYERQAMVTAIGKLFSVSYQEAKNILAELAKEKG